MQQAGVMIPLVFQGGTAHRFLFNLSWYLSEPTWPEPDSQLLNNAL